MLCHVKDVLFGKLLTVIILYCVVLYLYHGRRSVGDEGTRPHFQPAENSIEMLHAFSVRKTNCGHLARVITPLS